MTRGKHTNPPASHPAKEEPDHSAVTATVDPDLGDDVVSVFSRIGFEATSWMEWVLRFGDLDLTTLSPGERLVLREEVEAFVLMGRNRGPVVKRMKKGRVYLLKISMGCDPGGWGEASEPLHRVRPTSDDLSQLHRITQACLQELCQMQIPQDKRHAPQEKCDAFPGAKLVHTVRWEVTSPGFTFISIPNIRFCAGSGYVYAQVDRPMDAFRYILVYLLGHFSKDLWRCPECQKRFLARRYNQVFCGVRCQNRVAARKSRATPPDRVGKRGRPAKAAGKIQKQKAKTQTPTKGGRHGSKGKQ